MGVCSNKSKGLNHQEDQYLHLLDIKNPANVNQKYSKYFTLIENQYTGIGIRLTNQYTTNLSKKEWEMMQNQFWGRVMKSYKDSYKDSIYWQNIHKALSQDDQKSSIAILTLCKLKLISNSIQLLISDSINIIIYQEQVFQVPVFIINKPISWNNELLVLDFESSSLKVRIRSSKLPKDFLIQTQSTSTVLEIKQKILEVAKENSCRLYLNGRELIDQNQLGNYNITSGTLFCDYIFKKWLVLFYIMHKQKAQILFKCHHQHQRPEYEDSAFTITKIIEINNSTSIFELILENCNFIMDNNFCIQISSLQSLIYLGLNNCNIVSLQYIPKIESLKRLTLDYNFIHNSELINLKFYQDKLLSLSIIQNQLDFSDQSLLAEFYLFKKLIQLSIAGNYKDITEQESIMIRKDIFNNMKNLVFLDTIAKGEFLSTCIQNQFSDQKQEQDYLSRIDVVDWQFEKEYKQFDQ
ncbi:unnamed protein product [Paramecium pentaurelia]|uniref:Ubiquitin-like domain-containing protein n=1 Tax=Paramecium pentaurelia TaxID=43138 RepID=A0A8S1RXZ8_9CILI|nr:unnamed protein product [Paramecium pentaurelia]